MNRRTARELALRLLYAMDCTGMTAAEALETLNADNFTSLQNEDEMYRELPDTVQRTYITKILYGVREKQAALDETIRQYAIGWKLERISRITVSVLRLCLYEIQFMDASDVPPAAAISEAVAMAKQYDGTEAGAFVNGILGTYMRAQEQPEVKA